MILSGPSPATVIVFISWNDAGNKPSGFVRVCPVCLTDSVIRHGWRARQAHDASHTWIRIPRGICKLCHLTITMLPAWLIPGGHYSLLARQQAAGLAAEPGRSLEACVPESADKDRLADPSTVRRWLLRRTESLLLSLLGNWLQPPTLFAWDWRAAIRTLIPETNST